MVGDDAGVVSVVTIITDSYMVRGMIWPNE